MSDSQVQTAERVVTALQKAALIVKDPKGRARDSRQASLWEPAFMLAFNSFKRPGYHLPPIWETIQQKLGISLDDDAAPSSKPDGSFVTAVREAATVLDYVAEKITAAEVRQLEDYMIEHRDANKSWDPGHLDERDKRKLFAIAAAGNRVKNFLNQPHQREHADRLRDSGRDALPRSWDPQAFGEAYGEEVSMSASDPATTAIGAAYEAVRGAATAARQASSQALDSTPAAAPETPAVERTSSCTAVELQARAAAALNAAARAGRLPDALLALKVIAKDEEGPPPEEEDEKLTKRAEAEHRRLTQERDQLRQELDALRAEPQQQGD